MENTSVGATLTEYEELEQNIISVIKKCNNDNLKESITKDVERLFNVKNATGVKYYALDNGLNVYVILNEDTAIDYMISSEPLYREEKFIGGDNKEHSNYYYSEKSCIEYSIGGMGNGVPIDDIDNKYVDAKHIAFLGPSYKGVRLQKEIIAGKDAVLSTPMRGHFWDAKYNDDKLQEDYNKGNLISYLSEYKPNLGPVPLDLVKSFLTIAGKVKEKAQGQTVDQKKGFFKNLLAKNKKLDEQVNIFGKQGPVR